MDDKIKYELDKMMYSVKGLAGFKNIGNTCYMNAVLQCLCSSSLFCSWILKNNFQETTFVHHLKQIVDAVWRMDSCVIIPAKFKEKIEKHSDTFIGNNQNDCQELLSLILDVVHEETKRKVKIEFTNMSPELQQYCVQKNYYRDIAAKDPIYKSDYKIFKHNNIENNIISKAYTKWKEYIVNSYSIITAIFTGLQYSQINCTICNSIFPKFEPFSILSLPIPTSDKVSIYDCFSEYCKTELLVDDNQYKCKKCDMKVNCGKSLSVWEPPDLFIFHIKRFKKTGAIIRKISTLVTFPINDLDIQPLLTPYHPIKNTKYNLWAICCHAGISNYGHYIAYCKNLINNKWYEFNDETINYIPDEYVEEELVSDKAYVLFYMKQ